MFNLIFQVEQLVECRIDHYQTLEKVQVSVFAKKVDKERSTVVLTEDEVRRFSTSKEPGF